MTREEFKTSILPLQQPFYRLARWMMANDEDAEDISQEIVLKLWKMRSELSRYNNPKALGLKMTRNLCLDSLKKKGRGALGIENSPEVGHSVGERQFEAKDSLDLVRKLIQKLPEPQRVVLQLRGVEELDMDEIAEVTELTTNNVRVLLSRARKQLRDEYEKYQKA